MFINRGEDEIQDDMVGASGMIIYWSRFVFSNEGGFQQQLSNANNGEGIKLIRNQAMVSIANGTSNGFINITGYAVTNIHAFGTTAPYHPENRFQRVGNKPHSDNAKPWTLKFEILDVYPGTKYKDTAISDLYFDGIDVH